MHRAYFPACSVDGPIEPPIAFGHLGLQGAVPNKCSSCEHLFEGSCTRAIKAINEYLHLDYGDCGIPGPTDPVTYEDTFVESKVQVPRKCSGCRFLSVDTVRGFTCTKDANKWGDFPRGLDWGAWHPDHVYLQLELPKVTTREMTKLAYANDMVGFIKEHRRVNPGLSLSEARLDYADFQGVIHKK
ncbi:unnamed protein product [Ectocarpus sp. 4 AP-2014]